MNIIIDSNIIRQDFKLQSIYFDILLDYLKKTHSKFILPDIVRLVNLGDPQVYSITMVYDIQPL